MSLVVLSLLSGCSGCDSDAGAADAGEPRDDGSVDVPDAAQDAELPDRLDGGADAGADADIDGAVDEKDPPPEDAGADADTDPPDTGLDAGPVIATLPPGCNEPLDRTVATHFYDAVRCLFEGAEALQEGVADGALTPARVTTRTRGSCGLGRVTTTP